jgi:O-antigen/teichoic acid export membrane protein
VLSWTATLVVARILSPSDYGLFGLATLYAGLVQLINEFGLGAAVVRRRDLTEPQIAAVGGVSLALGASLWGLSALACTAGSRVLPCAGPAMDHRGDGGHVRHRGNSGSTQVPALS